MNKTLPFIITVLALLGGAMAPAHALIIEDTVNARLACAETVEPIASTLSDKEIKEGMVDALTNLCLVGYQVAQADDEQTNSDNLNKFDANLADPKSDLMETQHMKDAYILGFNLGVSRG